MFSCWMPRQESSDTTHPVAHLGTPGGVQPRRRRYFLERRQAEAHHAVLGRGLPQRKGSRGRT